MSVWYKEDNSLYFLFQDFSMQLLDVEVDVNLYVLDVLDVHGSSTYSSGMNYMDKTRPKHL